MYEFLAHPITLLCLGTIFILVALLFFYFKRTFSLLEHAQMQQARILQQFITNMEMSQIQRGAAMPPSNLNQNQPLINVSDDEKSQGDSGSDEDTDDESEEESDEDSNESNSVIDIHASEELETDEKDIKVIHLENSHLEEVENLEIEELEKSDDDDEDDDDDDDDDDDEESRDTEEPKVVELSEPLESVNLDKIEIEEVAVDYKNMNVNALKTIAKEKGLMSDGEKKTKKELIKLLEEHK